MAYALEGGRHFIRCTSAWTIAVFRASSTPVAAGASSISSSITYNVTRISTQLLQCNWTPHVWSKLTTNPNQTLISKISQKQERKQRTTRKIPSSWILICFFREWAPLSSLMTSKRLERETPSEDLDCVPCRTDNESPHVTWKEQNWQLRTKLPQLIFFQQLFKSGCWAAICDSWLSSLRSAAKREVKVQREDPNPLLYLKPKLSTAGVHLSFCWYRWCRVWVYERF
jgi:hypothetical protein